jgi:hypothetical protein
MTICLFLALAGAPSGQLATAQKSHHIALPNDFNTVVRPFLSKYCLSCHSTAAKRGSLDLERFTTPDAARKDLKPWQGVIDHLEVGDMPPRGAPQPTAGETRPLIAWVRKFLAAEARAHAGDPGFIPLRRLSNAEYNATIRDLTGVDLQPTREFPADGAAGEGFTNAAEALTDISPTLLTKYFDAAKEVAAHAVPLPDGLRFAPTKTRQDWTDESTARLRAFYADNAPSEGKLPVATYLAATVRNRAALMSGSVTVDAVATKEQLNAKYLGILWRTLSDTTPSYPLDSIRAHWRSATEKDVPALTAEVAAWQDALWQLVRVGSYVRPVGNGFAESTTRQVAVSPSPVEARPIRVAVKPLPGQNDVVLTLASHDLIADSSQRKNPNSRIDAGQVVWQRPRFEAAGKPPLLLRDYAQFGPAYEVDYPSVFADSSRYLAAAVEAANNRSLSVADLANRHGLNAAFLNRWIAVLAVQPFTREPPRDSPGRVAPAVALDLLEEKVQNDGSRPAINGWRRKGADLPVLVTNSSDRVEQIPGRASPHGVMVHPTPTEFVAVAWKSPITGSVGVRARITHAHPACGNGVAWWLEHRHGEQAMMFAEGALELGAEAKPAEKRLHVERGDLIFLAVDAKDGNHACDLTDIALRISQTEQPGQVWDLASDIADTVLAGNPHADKYGNPAVWSFVKGPTRPVAGSAPPIIPPDSVLGQWREAAADPGRQPAAASLAAQAQRLLIGVRPAGERDPDRLLYDNLVSVDSPLFRGISPAALARSRSGAGAYGLPAARFGTHPGGKPIDDASLITPADSVVEVRLPAALFQGREFVVEGRLASPAEDRAVAFQVQTTRPGTDTEWDGKGPVVATTTGAAYRQLIQGCDQFRRCFPVYVCFPNVIPNDEVVSLKMFHREDEPLMRLFLSDEQTRRLDRLWAEHRFISRQPALENEHLPLFIGFVTQDQPKEMVAYFEGQRTAFRKRAEAFEQDEKAAIPKQLGALLEFAGRAYRRPLHASEKTELLGLYQTLRQKGVAHEEALRGVLARILVAPAFLFRIEQTPAGKSPAPINDWELATRLSYFLWSSAPDAELRRLAAAGQLHQPQILAQQARRMLKDDRVRTMAIEFGAQWIHVRGFDELKEKNEKLFPTFDAGLRQAIYEETILFFQDLFQGDRPVTNLLDTDYTYLNATLAKHYGIPGVSGPQWRRVDGVRRYGRGGVLGLASVQATEAGASRTSPVLRGNWVVETLLGERLPRPPANVPKLPEEEGDGGLTLRQQVEKHARVPECAVCHRRIDPFGFALERYDPIGRFREKDLSGLPVDARARLKDGTEFEGIDGLRTYLLTKKKDVIVRLFCRRLLGYALGRAVINSDQPLIDEMVSNLNRNDGHLAAAVQTIVLSPQFRMIRSRESVGNQLAQRR